MSDNQAVDFFFKGVILPFWGSQAPPGWKFCDGTQGTPDLRGKFLMGASDAHPFGSSGGTEQHSHDVVVKNGHRIVDGFEGQGNECERGRTDAKSHLPPFLAINYIMRM